MRETSCIGRQAELLASVKLMGLGFKVSWPIDPSSRYDLLVDVGHTIHKIQVKSTSCIKRDKPPHLGCYRVYIVRGSERPYTANEVSYFMIYIAPLDAWYIIPTDKVTKCMSIYTNSKRSRHLKYRENWGQLFEL